MEPDDVEEGKEKDIEHLAEPTLLPAPVAGIVSLVTKSSSLYLQLGMQIIPSCYTHPLQTASILSLALISGFSLIYR